MTPKQWARVLRAGLDGCAREPRSGSAVNALALALDAMSREAQEIAEETR